MICVIGLGYIGLPTALMLAKCGNEVVGIDYNKELVGKLNNGEITFKEDGLKELYDDAVKAGIRFTSEYEKANVYIVAVPTPYESKSKKIDPTYVVNAVKSVAEVCDGDAIIAVESTISPGTIDKYVRPIINSSNLKSSKHIHIAHVPERIIPGNMIYELCNNNRTIGVDDINVGNELKKIYSSFCKGVLTITDIRTAEMTKVVENTFRDINIAFANELAKICRVENMDVYEIIRIANMHPRVNILQPGPGVGGHCISVDPWFLVGDYPEQAKLIKLARNINDTMPAFVLERVKDIMKYNSISDFSKVGIYGMSYKADVDDVREAPTFTLIDLIKAEGCSDIKVYDPMIERDVVDGQYHDFDAFINDVDMVIVMVGHTHIKEHEDALRGKVVLDTRNVCEKVAVNRL